MKERINEDWKQAMRDKDEVKKLTLSSLRAAIKNLEIEKKGEVSTADIGQLIQREVKKRKDSLEAFGSARRFDLALKEQAEIDVLNEYLPQQLTDDEARQLVSSTTLRLSKLAPLTMKDMGRVMKEVMGQAAGKADPRFISQLVKEELSNA